MITRLRHSPFENDIALQVLDFSAIMSLDRLLSFLAFAMDESWLDASLLWQNMQNPKMRYQLFILIFFYEQNKIRTHKDRQSSKGIKSKSRGYTHIIIEASKQLLQKNSTNTRKESYIRESWYQFCIFFIGLSCLVSVVFNL